MKIFKERAGVISKDECWVCVHKCYLYTGDSLFKLINNMIKYWNTDYALVG